LGNVEVGTRESVCGGGRPISLLDKLNAHGSTTRVKERAAYHPEKLLFGATLIHLVSIAGGFVFATLVSSTYPSLSGRMTIPVPEVVLQILFASVAGVL